MGINKLVLNKPSDSTQAKLKKINVTNPDENRALLMGGGCWCGCDCGSGSDNNIHGAAYVNLRQLNGG